MNIKFIFPILIFISFSFLLFNIEKFSTIDFTANKDPYFGFCSPNLPKKLFQSGNFVTQCWNNMALEDCQLLNKTGKNCGYNTLTGESLPCHHHLGSCKKKPQCFSTCYQQVDPSKQPYMIDVEYNNLIQIMAPL